MAKNWIWNHLGLSENWECGWPGWPTRNGVWVPTLRHAARMGHLDELVLLGHGEKPTEISHCWDWSISWYFLQPIQQQRCWRFAQKSDCLGFFSKVIPIEPGFSSPRVHQAQLVYYRLCPSLSYNWLIDVDCWLWHLTGQQTYTNLVRSIYTPISDYEKTLHWSFGLAAALHPAGAAGPALCRNDSTHNRLPGDNDLPGATARRLLEAIGSFPNVIVVFGCQMLLKWAERVNLKQHLKHRIRKAGD